MEGVLYSTIKKEKMSKKLAGVIFYYNAEMYDYCYIEAVNCLLECTDYVYVVAGGIDETYEKTLNEFKDNERVTIIYLSTAIWDLQTGKEKLNFFTNIGIEAAERGGYEYVFQLQADEILHQKSYPEIRKAIETGAEGYMCTRVNLWQSPYLQLDVPQERKPCSTSIIRLAKTCYRSVDDAENIGVPMVEIYFEPNIRIYHMGFVRKREIMPNKIRHIQQQVFGMEHADSKLEGMEIFDPTKWFDPKTDLKPIDEPLPKLIQQWAKQRYYGD